MAARPQRPLTLERLGAIAHGWLPAFSASTECEAVLSSHGYNAFHIHREHLSQFASGPKDIAVHKLCYLELCKYLVTAAPVLRGHPDECRSIYYQSALLNERRLELAKRAGFEEVKTWLETAKSSHWETEPDPLIRAQASYFVSHGQEVVHNYRTSFDEQARAALGKEAARFPPANAGSLQTLDRLSAFQSTSHECLSHLGFRPVTTRQRNYAALDLDISDDLVLRWSIGELHSFFNINCPAVCQPTLHLRQHSFKKKIKNADGEARLLQFPFPLLVEGVKDVYVKCSDIRELEVIIRVHALMVEWVLPYIFEAVTAA